MSLRSLAAVISGTALALSPLAVPAASATGTQELAWVSTYDPSDDANNSIQLMDLLTGTVSRRIELAGQYPSQIAYSKSANTVWYLSQPWNYADSSLGFVDLDTDMSTYELNTSVVNSVNGTDYTMVDDWIGDIVASPDGSKIYVSAHIKDSSDGALLVFDANTGNRIDAVNLMGVMPETMAANPATNEIYVLTYGPSGNEVINVIDASNDSVTDVSPDLDWGTSSCDGQTQIAFNAATNSVYAVCWAASTVAVWNVGTDETLAISTDLDPAGPASIGIDVSTDGKTIVIGTCYDGTLLVTLDSSGVPASNLWSSVSGTIKNVHFLPDGTRFAGGGYDGSMYVSSATTNVIEHAWFPADSAGAQSQNYSVYVSDFATIDDPWPAAKLAETGFELAPYGLAGLGLLAVGIATSIRRRRIS